jgi:hypothetical protein
MQTRYEVFAEKGRKGLLEMKMPPGNPSKESGSDDGGEDKKNSEANQ